MRKAQFAFLLSVTLTKAERGNINKQIWHRWHFLFRWKEEKMVLWKKIGAAVSQKKNDPALKCVRQIKLLHTGTQSYSLTLSLTQTHSLTLSPPTLSLFLPPSYSLLQTLIKTRNHCRYFCSQFSQNNFNLEPKFAMMIWSRWLLIWNMFTRLERHNELPSTCKSRCQEVLYP